MPETQKTSPALNDVCPFLGSRTDPASCFTFPTNENYCYKVDNSAPVQLGYQQRVCLGPEYAKCKIYSGKQIKYLPKEIQGEPPRKERQGISPLKYLLVLVLILLFLLFIFYLGSYLGVFEAPGFIQIGTTQSVSDAGGTISWTHEETDRSAATEVLPPTLTPGLKLTPSASPSTAPTLGPAAMTPFGPHNGFLIHVIREGESMGWLVERYGTTLEVLRQLNDFPAEQPLLAGQAWLVMPGRTEIEGLGKYQILQIQEPTQLGDIADSYGASEEELRAINSLGLGNLLPAGRWLIIPISDGEASTS